MSHRYYSLQETPKEYPMFTIRLLQRLVFERRIAFVKIGNRIHFAESDLDAFIEANRTDAAGPAVVSMNRLEVRGRKRKDPRRNEGPIVSSTDIRRASKKKASSE